MKKSSLGILTATGLTLGLMAFTAIQTGSIKGTLTPANSVNEVWAVSGTDTLKATPDSTSFTITEAKAGSYTIVVDAKDPYKDVTMENVAVKDGEATDLGEIKLEQ